MTEFTAAAEQALSEYADLERERIVDSLRTAALEIAASDTGDLVTASEIAEAIHSRNARETSLPRYLHEIDRNRYRASRYRRLGLAYVTIGLVGALAFSAVQFGRMASEDGLDVPALLSLVSVLITLAGVAIIFYARERSAAVSNLVRADAHREVGRFVGEWQEFETRLLGLTGSSPGTLRIALDTAVRNELLTREDLSGLQRLLRLRNQIVHEPLDVDAVRLRDAVVELQTYSKRLDSASSIRRARPAD